MATDYLVHSSTCDSLSNWSAIATMAMDFWNMDAMFVPRVPVQQIPKKSPNQPPKSLTVRISKTSTANHTPKKSGTYTPSNLTRQNHVIVQEHHEPLVGLCDFCSAKIKMDALCCDDCYRTRIKHIR